MEQIITNLHDLLTHWTSPDKISEYVRLILIIIIGIPLIQFLAKLGKRLSNVRISDSRNLQQH
ncbi:MAG TPA: hypothetical protein PLE74_08750 [Candidatus Cloacimonadota bacterium]|nr:hypothetical protein [Candidatus Cloacimonadota bacterium]HPT72355.1 hypothetical protein [Candidatus Cloacimonadota bacterium]